MGFWVWDFGAIGFRVLGFRGLCVQGLEFRAGERGLLGPRR